MRRLGTLCVLVLVLVCAAASPRAQAHSEISVRLSNVDKRFADRPSDVGLLLKRAQLYRAHGRWTAALQDYQRLRQLAPDLPENDFYLGRAWLETGHPALALPLLDRFLKTDSMHARALIVRARAAQQLNNSLAAADDLARALKHLADPTPELYLRRAKLLVDEGPGYVEDGLRALDEGIARFGPLVTLVEFAVAVETDRRHYAAALRRIETLPARLQDSPRWLARRGDVQTKARRFAAAGDSYTTALAAMAALPRQRRQVKAMAKLEAHLVAALESLATVTPRQ